VRGQCHASAALYPGKDPVPFVQEAGWAPGPVWTGVENLAPPGFDLRTVQPVASRYTDCATRPSSSLGSRRDLKNLFDRIPLPTKSLERDTAPTPWLSGMKWPGSEADTLYLICVKVNFPVTGPVWPRGWVEV